MNKKNKEPEVEKPKVKQRYTVTIEGMAPVRLQLDCWAFDEEEALQQLDNPRLMNIRERPDIDLSRLHRRKVSIKDTITSLVKLVKNY